MKTALIIIVILLIGLFIWKHSNTSNSSNEGSEAAPANSAAIQKAAESESFKKTVMPPPQNSNQP